MNQLFRLFRLPQNIFLSEIANPTASVIAVTPPAATGGKVAASVTARQM
jgi:hypothetical protein